MGRRIVSLLHAICDRSAGTPTRAHATDGGSDGDEVDSWVRLRKTAMLRFSDPMLRYSTPPELCHNQKSYYAETSHSLTLKPRSLLHHPFLSHPTYRRNRAKVIMTRPPRLLHVPLRVVCLGIGTDVCRPERLQMGTTPRHRQECRAPQPCASPDIE